MTSYLRMQAAAGEPELAGRDGHPERQDGRQNSGPDRMMLRASRAVACPDVDVQSLQVSGYSCTGKGQPPPQSPDFMSAHGQK